MTGAGEFIISFAGENHYHLISSTPVFRCSANFAYKLDVFVHMAVLWVPPRVCVLRTYANVWAYLCLSAHLTCSKFEEMHVSYMCLWPFSHNIANWFCNAKTAWKGFWLELSKKDVWDCGFEIRAIEPWIWTNHLSTVLDNKNLAYANSIHWMFIFLVGSVTFMPF